MNFTEKQKEGLLKRFNYGKKELSLLKNTSYLIYATCPLCMEYSNIKSLSCCKVCKKTHNHNCVKTLKEIVGGKLHFYFSHFYLYWSIKDDDIVKSELGKIVNAITKLG